MEHVTSEAISPYLKQRPEPISEFSASSHLIKCLPFQWGRPANPHFGLGDWLRWKEHPLKEFLKVTIIGGALFLPPVALILFLLSHALRLTKGLAEPISKGLHLDQLGGVAGVGAATVLSVLVLVLISFAAGFVTRTAVGRRISHWSENSLLGSLPQYQLMKSMAEGLARLESASGLKPALVSIEDGWQIGYLLEQLENDWFAVFLPQAPTPVSGNVMYLPVKRVRPLGITMVQAMSIVKAIGVGSAAALRGVDLSLPSADH
jgi:uncharacterized membrane protein